MIRNFFCAGFLLVLLFAVTVFGQTSAPTPPAASAAVPPPSLETIVSEAASQVKNYQETFKNLLAEERKTFERFDKNGQVKDRSIVESTFLVYQSPRNEKISSELRNVTKVNDKLVPDSQQRSEKLLAELQKATTLERELEKLQKESARYDKTLEIYGLTISEAVALSDTLRPFFDFQLTGTEIHNGSEVYVVGYRQARKSPFISLNNKNSNAGGEELTLNFSLDVPGALKKNDAQLRGKLWIDAKSFQVWREERELVVQSDSAPIVLLETVFEYQPSEYGILVPKQISLVSNAVKKNSNDYAAIKDTRVNFDYSKFRKTETDVKIIDDDQ